MFFLIIRLVEDVLKTSWKIKNCYAEDVFKTSWKTRNDCWDVPKPNFYNTSFMFSQIQIKREQNHR